MSSFDLYDLPEELVLLIAELLGIEELTAFVQTSHNSRRIGSELVPQFSIEEIEEAFKNAALSDRPQAMLRLLPLVQRAGRNIRWYAIEALACACRANDVQAVKNLLAKDVPYNPPLELNYRHNYLKVGSPLVCALKCKESDGLSALVDAGADINTVLRRPATESLLHYAAAEGHTALVRALVLPDSNLNVNDRDHALKAAATRGHAHIVELLLIRNADVHASDDRGRTALSWAAAGGYPDVINLILKHGAALEHTDKYGYTPFLIAIWKRRTPAVKILLQRGANVNHENSLGRSALSLAAGLCMNKGLIVSTLLSHNADPNHFDPKGRTPLSYAYENHALKAAGKLLRAGADATKIDNAGYSVNGYYRPGSGNASMKYLEEENVTRSLGLYLPPDPIHPDLRMGIPPEEGELGDWSDVEWVLGPE